MKIPTVSVLGCVAMVLVGAAAFPEEKVNNDQSERSDLVKRYLFCKKGWTKINGGCFQYVRTPKSWARAETNCQSMGAHLASVRSINEYHEIQRMILSSHDYSEAWIGGSDAQGEKIWFWTDGSEFKFTHWCDGEPNNLGKQHCLQMNHSVKKCWDDNDCKTLRPYVCAKRGWGLIG